jgi:hypothetical protein
MLSWAHRHRIALWSIVPGKSNQNACIESFNGRFRAECLNEHWFVCLAHARAVIEAWRREGTATNERRCSYAAGTNMRFRFLKLHDVRVHTASQAHNVGAFGNGERNNRAARGTGGPSVRYSMSTAGAGRVSYLRVRSVECSVRSTDRSLTAPTTCALARLSKRKGTKPIASGLISL